MAGKRAQRGLTLVEILVVAAISSILFLAAAALLATLSAQRTNSRKRIDRLSEGFTALTILERTVLNAGYHFPSPRFGFRVYNNVQNGSFVGGIPVEDPCTNAVCIIPNTDVLEIVEGHPGNFGMVSGAANDGGGAAIDVFLQLAGPISIGDTAPYYFLFVSDDGRSCIGRGSTGGATTSMNVQMVDRDLNDVNATYYGSGGVRNYVCPAPGMMVAAQIDRRHYFVAMPNADAGEQIPSLYMRSAGTGNFVGPAQLLVYGVDNFQVTPLIRNTDAGLVNGCTNTLCRCNVPGATCVLDGGNDDNDFVFGEFVQGLELGISIRGDNAQRAYVSGQSGTVLDSPRPRLADETWTTPDNFVRTTQRQTFMLRNFSQVQP